MSSNYPLFPVKNPNHPYRSHNTRLSVFAAVCVLFLAAVTVPAGELVNLSTRGSVGTGENVLIGGIIITGSGTKRILLEGLGASLNKAGVSSTATLQDPLLSLYQTNGDLLQSNDDWRYGPELDIEASGVAPTDDYEPAVIADVAPGQYTAILSGYAHSGGIAVVEVFDLGGATGARLAELSTRGNVQLGDGRRDATTFSSLPSNQSY